MIKFKQVSVILGVAFAIGVMRGIPAHGFRATSLADPPLPPTQSGTTSGTSLGVFSMINGGYSGANALTVLYGSSSEGDPLITYWQGSADIGVLSFGNSQFEIVETLGGRCMTDNGLGATITITTCTGNSKQLFSLKQGSNGSYILQSTAGTCLASAGAGTVAQSQSCNASPNQNWTFSGTTPLNLGTTTSATATTNSSGSVTTTTTADPSTTASGGTTSGTSLGVFSMINGGYSGANALTVLYGSSSEGDPLITYWQGSADIGVLSLGNSQFEIVETLGGRCMTDNGLGATITITTCTGNPKQLFSLKQGSNGSYILQSTAGRCLASAGAGTVAQSQSCNASPNQNWTFSGTTPLNLGATTSATTSAVPSGYHLTFDDEFQSLSMSDTNGTGSKWYTHTIQCCLGDSLSPPRPTYMAGLSDGLGKNPYSIIPGGGLDIRLQRTNGAWYSGVLATVDGTGAGFSQKYGYFEMKAQFPSGLGTWPAFWLLNSAHLAQGAPSGEIDVVEAYMQFPAIVDTTLHDYSNSTSVGTHQAPVTNMSNGFHTYGMLWTASTMTFYFDGGQIWQIPTPAIMNQPYYPIIDLGLGGGWPTDQTPQQSDMIVQYVRVYAP